MKTYTILKDYTTLSSNATANELFNFIPPGSKVISGGKEGDEPNKAVYRVREGGTITIIENP